jgi:hypothetical protein
MALSLDGSVILSFYPETLKASRRSHRLAGRNDPAIRLEVDLKANLQRFADDLSTIIEEANGS